MAGFLCAQTAVIKLTKAGPARLNAPGRLHTPTPLAALLAPFWEANLVHLVILRRSPYATAGSSSGCFGVFASKFYG